MHETHIIFPCFSSCRRATRKHAMNAVKLPYEATVRESMSGHYPDGSLDLWRACVGPPLPCLSAYPRNTERTRIAYSFVPCFSSRPRATKEDAMSTMNLPYEAIARESKNHTLLMVQSIPSPLASVERCNKITMLRTDMSHALSMLTSPLLSFASQRRGQVKVNLLKQ